MSGSNPLPAGQVAIIPPLGAGSLAAGDSWGSGQAASNARPLRGPPASFTRQPYLGQPPMVSSANGFGSGSGGGIVNSGSDADQSQGLIAIKVGLSPLTGGTVIVAFPATIPAGGLVFLADWATLVPVIASGVATLTWTGTRPLVTGEVLLIAYQWAVSQ
jgi:hypothetical protein